MATDALSSVVGDFANAGILEGDAQPASPSPRPGAAETDNAEGKGELLEIAAKDPTKAAKKIRAMWEAMDPAAKRRKVFWDQNKLWLMGIRGVRARPASTDINRWELYVPPGALDMPPTLDQIETLIDRMVSHVNADPAKPDVSPASDKPENRDGAEFATRLLEIEGGEAGTNDPLLFRTCQKKSSLFGSSFIYDYVEEDGGGWTEEPPGPDTQPGTPPVRQYQAKVCSKILTPYQVRPIPDTARDITECDGALILDITTVGDLKRRFPGVVGEWDSEQWQQVVDWKPEAAKWALPWYVQLRQKTEAQRKENGDPSDAATVVTLGVYYTSKGEYTDGAYLLTAGGQELLYSGPWIDKSEDGSRPLDLPIAQIKQLTDDISDDFYGRGLVQQLGPISEVRSATILAWLAYLDRFNYPHTFLPLGTTVQQDQLASRDGRAIYFNPQGQPVMETVPPFPADAKEFVDRAKSAEDDVVGIYASAAGQSNPEVRSGSHAEVEVQQSNINLTQIVANQKDGMERHWRVKLQLYRAFVRKQQRLEIPGEDGAYKERAWSGLDLRGAKDVKVAAGSFTQRSPEAKKQAVIGDMQLGLVAPEDGKRLLQGNLRSDFGLDDDPFVMKIRSELSEWRKGAPPEWVEQAEEADRENRMAELAYQQQAQAMVSQGQPAPPFQAPYAMPPGPFARVPADEEQDVARIRHMDLRREQASAGFKKAHPLWQQVLLAEYQAMKQAAGIMTVGEQQQAQAAQAEQQQRAAVEQEEAKARGAAQQNQQKTQGDIAKINAQTEGDIAEIRAKADAEPERELAGV